MKTLTVFLVLFLHASVGYANKERWDANRSEWSDLMLAIYDNDVEKFKSLIHSGIDVNFITPGKKGFKLSALGVAIRKNNEVAVAALLQTNRILKPGTMLTTAAAVSSGANVEMIIKYGGNPNDTIANGFSVLMLAANSGSKDVVAALLKNGANPNQFRRPDRINALMLAVLSGDKDKVTLLLNHGADKTMRDKEGHLPLFFVDHIRGNKPVTNTQKEELRALLR